uniref:Uncharacterized protein n=1 Tax=Anopheles darlingi TaxID=43151 RepID=A0A2M4DS82_ANODA
MVDLCNRRKEKKEGTEEGGRHFLGWTVFAYLHQRNGSDSVSRASVSSGSGRWFWILGSGASGGVGCV